MTDKESFRMQISAFPVREHEIFIYDAHRFNADNYTIFNDRKLMSETDSQQCEKPKNFRVQSTQYDFNK